MEGFKRIIYRPAHYEVSETQERTISGKYITFEVNGTWSVEIEGLVRLPGDQKIEAAEGTDEIECTYTFRFIEDLSEDKNVKGNKRLKKGKFVNVRVAKAVRK